jgi:hypothetical protein
MKSAHIFSVRKQGFNTTQGTGANLQHSSGVDTSEQTEFMLFFSRSLCSATLDSAANSSGGGISGLIMKLQEAEENA